MKAFTKLFLKLFDYSAALLFLLTATIFSQISLAQESGQAASSRDIKNSTSIGTNMVMPSAMLTSCKPSSLSDKGKSPNAMKFLRDAIELKLKTKDKVSLDLFVMSQCPFGVMAEQSIIPVIREFGNRVEFRLNFIAGEDVVNGRTVLNSLHGQPEIDEDIRQLVIARDFPEKLFAYLEARAENYRDDNWQTAAGKAGINADVVNLSSKSVNALDLFRSNMKKAQTSGVNASPTLWIEGVKYMDQLIDPTASSATACQTGNDPYTGAPYVVCTATPTYAWISANNFGQYHIDLICQSLGYAGIGRWGGTCGNVCGFCQGPTSCSSPGSATFSAGTSPNNCGSDSHGPLWCNTIQWECVGALSCTAPTISCPSNITVNNTPGSCGAVVNYPAATATGTSPTITYSQNSGTFFPVGTTTVTATATNTCGTASCTFTVTVNDNQAPVITCPANVTRQCGTSTIPSATGYATATDNCGATTVSYSDQSTSGSFLYLQTWESGTGGWFSKFGGGDPVILVSDPTAPSPSTVHRITTCASGGHYYSPLIPVVPGQTYCFSLWIRWEGGCWPFLGIDRYNAAGTNLGENWLIGQPGYPDGFGGTVTPVPATASGWNLYFKTITIPAGVTQVRLKNEMFSGATKGGATLGFFDNIGFTNGSCTTAPGFCNQNYQILRTWTATDGNGNSSSCLQTITVVDNTPPAITCPANISVQCGTSTAPAATGSATATDNCSTPVIGYSDVSSLTGCNGTGTITRTWRATDECGNSSTCVQTITVIDNTSPVITCPANITVVNTTGQCGANVNFAATATDNCSTPVITYSKNPGTFFIVGTTLVTATATDACNNQTQCSFNVTVTDNEAPSITCPAPVTVQCASAVPNPDINSVSVSDNCSTGITVTWEGDEVTPGNCANKFTITRTYKAIDASNNVATCTQTITVNDETAPTFTAPVETMVYTDADCNYDASVGVTGDVTDENDNCSENLQATFTDVVTNGECEGQHLITRTWHLVDACGNAAADQVQLIHVWDRIAPTFTRPADITINTDANCNYNASVTATGDVEDEQDNCSTNLSAEYIDEIINGTCPGSLVIKRTWHLTDHCGNPAVATQVQTITVLDNTAPTFTAPANITIYTDAECGYDASLAVTGDVTDEADNCSTGLQATYTDVTTDDPCQGSHVVTRTWQLVDNCGNHAADQVQIITVSDNTAPSITCPGDITVSNATGQCGANVSFAATAADNCGTPVITYSHNPGSFFAVGTTLVTATATDACGNTTQCSFNVIVNDTEKPVITLSNIFRCFADDNFGCSINLGATATDNCQVISLTSNAPGCFPVGTTTVTWTATDNHGNVTTKTQTVTRNPEINISICAGPTRTIYRGTTAGVGPFGPQSVNLGSTVSGGTPGYTYSWSPAAGLSNPNIANPVANPAVTTTYTLTVTDSKGCKRSLSITVNVLPLSSAVCSGNGNNVKFAVCHIPPGNPSNPQNICISVNALNAHLTSGSNGHNNCYLGPCQQNCFSTVPGGQSFVGGPVDTKEVVYTDVPDESEVKSDAFKVNVYPNPSAGEFNLQVFSKSNEPITVRILDVNGIVRSSNTVISKTNSVKVGSGLIGGTYLAEITQGVNRAIVKLVKLN